MGVYIKGMEMPKECRKCRFEVRGYCVASDRMDNRTRFVDDAPKKAWCPFIPVPPHGRLIDADVFFKFVEDKYKNARGDARKAYSDVLDLICAAGDIIPASEEGE